MSDDVKKETKKAAKPKATKKSTKAVVEDPVLFDLIRRPIITEKSSMGAEHNKVQFMVRPDADKASIKKAVESLFNVKVDKVNTINIKGKTKRFRGRMGKRADIRKAVVTLAEGQSIDLAAGLR